jgi:adenylosuccinate lyase
MRHIWSEENKRVIVRQVWVALASAQNNAGLGTADLEPI